MSPIQVIGGGLAGCEVALTLAARGLPVRLLEMKPQQRSPAADSDRLAELVCSNSLRSQQLGNAVGLLKEEMRRTGGHLIRLADAAAVPAGDALAVDRERFSGAVEAAIEASPLIERVTEVVEAIPEGRAIICTGPLTAPKLTEAIAAAAGREHLYFYDAIAPILDDEGLDWRVLWRQSRYDKGEADYANIPLSEDEYFAFIQALNEGDKVTPRAFEEARFFEGCLPVEVMAERGPLTLAHGPLKPVGLTDPRTGQRPYAVVQLRMENAEGSAWNMVGFQTRLRYPEQRRIFRALPGLAKAEFLRYGSVHRNTYLHAPSLLTDALSFRERPDLYFAGQITGVEGYVESIACGQLIAWHAWAAWTGRPQPIPPPTTAFGALYRHLRGAGIHGAYSPSNINWSLLAPMERQRREKKPERRARMAARALADLAEFWAGWAP
ncbi:methylenetetrahydrofolate--tRNA-(uracil(54)-C(5))-methyltransferase (FADH(2)-oxidizing) TrmFO [Myxococcota bacterium]|nr:methylenetetrahydrofolate--tRNA-(uracil(54)-C(5))-methyltransferase (FADH(2)-oxidizing) TrmFO [Myxococcota bacterium]